MPPEPANIFTQRRPSWAWPVVAAALLVGVAAERYTARVEPVGVDAHHEQVAAAVDTVDRATGPWLAQPVPVPTAAVDMLRPNALVSLRYEHVATGESANFLFVQVRDARDLIGHYPPVCYPGQGWRLESTRVIETPVTPAGWPDWQAAPVRTQYRFSRQASEGARADALVVDNLMILPGLGVQPDMESIDLAARNQQRKFFGAAQLQVVTDGAMSEEVRQAVFMRMLSVSASLASAAGGDAAGGTVVDSKDDGVPGDFVPGSDHQ